MSFKNVIFFLSLSCKKLCEVHGVTGLSRVAGLIFLLFCLPVFANVSVTNDSELPSEQIPDPVVESSALSLQKQTFNTNELISVAQLMGSGSDGDWIGIYPAGALKPDCQAQPDYVTWLLAEGVDQSTVFPAQQPGEYVVQLFQQGTYCHVGDPVSFTVEEDIENPTELLPSINAIFRPTEEHFPMPEAEVNIERLGRASVICYSTNGVVPTWRGGKCLGEGVMRIIEPTPSATVTLACNGETGPMVERPLNILFNWSGRSLYRANAVYQLDCDAPPIEPEPEPEPIEQVPTLSTDKASYAYGESVVVTYNGGTGLPMDWIGVFLAGTLNVSCDPAQGAAALAVTNGVGGTVSFDALPEGDYQAQLFEANSYCHLGEPVAFQVAPPEVVDQCPNDPDKTEPGECGCGVAEGTCNLNLKSVVVNPYAGVDWNTWSQYKANFHTHTTESDGDYDPDEVIDAYYAAGYKILAITDHDTVTWPWTVYNRDPVELGMLAVRGDEFSRAHHVNGFFDFTEERANHRKGIQDVQDVQNNGGLAVCHFNHPLRYNAPQAWDWYIPWYKQYPACVGIEAINRRTHAHELWDNINENLFADNGQLVWGYANDDMHNRSEYFRSFQFMLMPELTTSSLATSKKTGAFYFCHEAGGSGEARVPKLADIVVDNQQKTITLVPAGSPYESISWVGPGTQTVGNGLVFDFRNYPDDSFVRAELHGEFGSCYTQPFGIGTAE